MPTRSFTEADQQVAAASLARALTLILKRDGGEEGLTKGHGLETIDWSNQLSGDLSVGLAALNGLKIRTCSGLFSDFVRQTGNRMSMHVRSSAVDWRLNYDQPALGDEILFEQLTARIPDLNKEHRLLGINPLYAHVSEIAFDKSSGANIKVLSKDFKSFEQTYSTIGYLVTASLLMIVNDGLLLPMIAARGSHGQ